MQKLLHQLAREFLKRLTYGSVVGAVVVFLLVNSSAWKAAGAAFAHTDFAIAAWIADVAPGLQSAPPNSDVVTVAVTEHGYSRLFNSTSPLDRSVLVPMVDRLLDATSTTSAVIVIDFDLSPASASSSRQEKDQDRLESLLIGHRNRIVLPLPPTASTDSRIGEWVSRMCAKGILFGRSEIVQTFGLVDFGHDVGDSLSSVAFAALQNGAHQEPIASACRSLQLPTPKLERHGSSPQEIAAPMTLPIDGDASDYADALRQLGAHFVIFGGTWGVDDRFKTPFGDRFGVHLHAAKLQGYAQQRTTAPAFLQVILAVIVTAIVHVCAGYFSALLDHSWAGPKFRPASGQLTSKKVRRVNFLEYTLPGQRFRRGAGSRFLVLIFVGTVIGLTVIGSAAINSAVGYYFPTLILVGFCTVTLLADWGSAVTRRLQFEEQFATRGAKKLHEQFLNPVVQSMRSMRAAYWVMSKKNSTGNESQLGLVKSITEWSELTGQDPRLAAICEFVCAFSSLIARTAVPAASFIYLLLQ